MRLLALDEREAFFEKPALAGGRATVHLYRILDAEAEINRFPIGGAYSTFPGTEFLFGARVGHRFENRDRRYIDIGTLPVVNLGVAVAFYSHRHIFARFDFGDLIVDYSRLSGYGTGHQFQGTAGFGVWF